MANTTPAGTEPHGLGKTCHHKNKITRVTYSSATCEETIEACVDCGATLTPPKVECR